MKSNIIYEFDYDDDSTVEVIAKYNGDIEKVVNDVGASAEILSNSFVIIKTRADNINTLMQYNEIIYVELPKILRLFLNEEVSESCIRYSGENVGGLYGSGVLIGIIDSGIDKNVKFYDKIKYLLELNQLPDTTHGTMVASIINNIAPESDIAFVSIGRNDFFASDTDIMRGIKFIADSAEGRPFVINISYGTNNGSHDGNSLFEEYIDEVCQNYRCSIVVASGNEGDKGRHYSGNFNNVDEIEFSIDRGLKSVVLEVWKNFVDKVGYEIISPSGDRSGIISSTTEETNFILGNTKIYFVFTQPSPYNISEQVYIRFEGVETVGSGIWRLILHPISVVDGEYNIWTTQARFLSPSIFTTLTIPSTANRVISVGAYNSTTGSRTSFSGRGFTANNSVKPDISAPGVNVVVDGSSYTGTSVATPFVTASCALLMEWGIVKGNDLNMYGERLKAYLRAGAIRDNVDYPNRELGYGKLCLSNTYNELIDYSIAQNSVSPAYNNDYEEAVINYNKDIEDYLIENNIQYCSIESGMFMVMYYEKDNRSSSFLLNPLYDVLRENAPVLYGLMSEEFNQAAGISSVHRPPLELKGMDVVVGFVDTGINYTNEEFLYENGENRIYSIWDMTIEDETSEGVCFGRVFNNEEINNRTANTKDDIGHGTNMAINACGKTGAAPESTIVVVKLKRAKQYRYQREFVPEDVPAYSSADIMLGIDFVVKQAKILKKPLVIVLGLGTNNGGHDGSSALERYISYLGRNAGTIVVTPTGNEATARHHTSFAIDNDNNYYDIEVSVAENVKGFNMWIWNNILDKVEVSIISPIGEVIPRVTAQVYFSNEYILFQTNTRVKICYMLPVFQTTAQRTSLSFSNPLAGVWRIRVYGSSVYSKIHSWLPISQFVGDKVVFTQPDAFSTITLPSTAENVMCVGSYSPTDNTVYPQSGRGPNRLGDIKPDFVAPTNNNSSIAASVTAGAAAILMQWGINEGNFYSLNSTTATALIINAAKQSSNDIYPNNISGYGLLDLYNVFFKL